MSAGLCMVPTSKQQEVLLSFSSTWSSSCPPQEVSPLVTGGWATGSNKAVGWVWKETWLHRVLLFFSLFFYIFFNFIRGIIPVFKGIEFLPFFVICCSTFPQNTSLVLANETTAGNSMRLNPHIHYYSTVYIASMAAALFLKTMRGLLYVKVS